ncbi:hypothetical protein EJF36_12085 [Bacillus sp. HMF5848]|uniref:hypothetical protein n=1 Tax=Bacillus sp. HMF5848 TaxID=2495421 RepID=UPI000F7B6D98|nr:hypothetical protein [Bacillus sp. HMF5848]RSK27557.1 hypothetical protein EJF36_12085 [Bacillus sp. HMF5848]
MKNKNLIYLILTLGVSSGTMLTNSFIVTVPNWIGIVSIVIAVAFLVLFFCKNKAQQQKIFK